MASVILDITTDGLIDAQRNVKEVRNLITAGTSVQMLKWYNEHMKKTMIRIIETGEGVDSNFGKYARDKESRYGISHGLGILSGGLYFGVLMTQPTVKETRGNEVRFAVKFVEPYYVAYVVEGTADHVGRDFIEIAREREWQVLLNMLGGMFEGLDFTLPYPQLLHSILGPRTLASLRG